MIRAVVAAFFGYVVMAICVMAGIAVVWFSLGNAFAFSGETTRASNGWSIAMLLCDLVAAIAGGCVAAKIGGPKGRLAVRVLVGLIIILGGLIFLSQMNAQPPPLPAGLAVRDLTFTEAGQYFVSPMWYNVAVIVVGGIGAWLGGRICLPPAVNRSADSTEAAASQQEVLRD